VKKGKERMNIILREKEKETEMGKEAEEGEVAEAKGRKEVRGKRAKIKGKPKKNKCLRRGK
jgi:hypothetical protein